MLLVTVIPFFAFCVCALEPPFPPDAVRELDRLSKLPSLISQDQLLAGLTSAQLAAYLASGKVDNTNNSLPNPIASTFPNMTTGTINGSFVVLPIDYSLARAVVPRKWSILRESIKAVLPFFPEDKFPVRNPKHARAALNLIHSCSSFLLRESSTTLSPQISRILISASVNLLIQDPMFREINHSSQQSAQFRFPFIDLLGDGYSTFSYVPTFFVSENIAALAGARTYGEDVVESISDPPHDPYAHVPGARDGSIYFNVNRVNSSGPPVLNTTYRPQPGRFGLIGDYPLSL